MLRGAWSVAVVLALAGCGESDVARELRLTREAEADREERKHAEDDRDLATRLMAAEPIDTPEQTRTITLSKPTWVKTWSDGKTSKYRQLTISRDGAGPWKRYEFLP